MLRNKLRAMLTAEQKENIILPVGYRRVEYLESTGTQYIDSGIKVKDIRQIELVVEVVSKKIYSWAGNETGSIILGTNDLGDNNIALSASVSDSMRFKWGSVSTFLLTPINYPSGFYHLKMTPSYVMVDNKILNYKTVIPTATNTMGIFKGKERTGSQNYGAAVRLKYLKFNDGELAYFASCIDGNNKPCLYDVTRKKTFYNTGTGTFPYGKIIT